MLDGSARRRLGGEGLNDTDARVIAGTFGPIALSVSAGSPELVDAVHRAGDFNSIESGSFELDLVLDLGREGARPTGDPGAAGWDVWGSTPAWDTTVRRVPGGLSAAFSLDPVFVAGLSRSRVAALDALRGAALRMAFALAAPLAGGLLVHGAALVDPQTNEATLFVGASGAGKTTMATRLPGWHVVSDDTFLVWQEGPRWYVTGTPLRGREGHAVAVGRFPVAGLVALSPGAATREILRRPPAEAFAELIARTFFYPSAAIPTEAQGMLVDTANAMAGSVPFFVLRSNLSHALADLGDLMGGRHV